MESALPARERAGTRARDLVVSPRASAWCVARSDEAYLVYTVEGRPVDLDLSKATGSFELTWVDGVSGAAQREPRRVLAGRVVTLTPPRQVPSAAWLSRR